MLTTINSKAKVCHRTSVSDGSQWLGLGFLIVLVPLWLPSANDPAFERGKVLIAGIAVSLLWLSPRIPIRMSWLAVALLLSFGVSTVLSLDPARAFFGSLERSQGFAFVLILALLALARPPWQLCARLTGLSTLAAAAWSYLQRSGLEATLLGTHWIGADSTRTFAGFGNPTAMANWLAMAIPVCFGLAVRTQPRHWRLIGAAAGISGLFALYWSASRGAWIGLGLAVAILVNWRMRAAKPSMRLALLVGTVATISIAIALFNAHARTESVTDRIQIWSKVNTHLLHLATAAAERPSAPTSRTLASQPAALDTQPWKRLAFGYGPDLQAAVLQGAVQRRSASAQFVDRAHQFVFDAVLEWGLVGTLLLLAVILKALWRIRIDPIRLCAALAGFFAWQFGFALSAEKVLWVLILFADTRTASCKAELGIARGRMPLAIVLVGLQLFSFSKALLPYAAFRHPEHAHLKFVAGKKAHRQGDFEAAHRYFIEAAQLDPYRHDMAQVAQSYLRN